MEFTLGIFQPTRIRLWPRGYIFSYFLLIPYILSSDMIDSVIVCYILHVGNFVLTRTHFRILRIYIKTLGEIILVSGTQTYSTNNWPNSWLLGLEVIRRQGRGVVYANRGTKRRILREPFCYGMIFVTEHYQINNNHLPIYLFPNSQIILESENLNEFARNKCLRWVEVVVYVCNPRYLGIGIGGSQVGSHPKSFSKTLSQSKNFRKSRG